MNWSEFSDEVDFATYSVEDDKIRIHSGRVSRELFDALRDLRFQRAPQQGFFYAKWSPAAEQVTLELCGDIDDEDTTLEERAQARAERYGGYSENAASRAESAQETLESVASGIPMGQPILVGHHSERKHRKDVERIQAMARRAVDEFDKAEYWEDRAERSLRHAQRKYKPNVVYRRIKGLKADKRKHERDRKPSLTDVLWFDDRYIKEHFDPDGWPTKGFKDLEPEQQEELKAARKKMVESRAAHADKWIRHIDAQIAYWEAVYKDQTGDTKRKVPKFEKGGFVLVRDHWAQIARINKDGEGEVSSLSLKYVDGQRRWPRVAKLEYVQDYNPDEPVPTKDVKTTKIASPPKKREESDAEKRARELKEQADNIKVAVSYDPDYYPAPAELVDYMLGHADIRHGDVVLEPSAGGGAISDKIRERYPDNVLICCERNSTAIDVLVSKGYKIPKGTYFPAGAWLLPGDFLKLSPAQKPDRVVMNPPFSNLQDVDHVMHAYELLKPGGRLVAIMSESAFFSSRDKAKGFRKWLDGKGWDNKLEHGAFAESGTNVATRLVVIDKP